MRLLNIRSRQLQEFFDYDIPPYAILSHTWGEDEVSFQDLHGPDYKRKAGYAKIDGCCRQAERENIEWVWVDTCCINKESSAELSEAINSMFRWYQNAEVCYTYLCDVSENDIYSGLKSAFRKARWFSRGWTLQELLAPRILKFFGAGWGELRFLSEDTGELFTDGLQRAELIETITGINYEILIHDRPFSETPVAERMSWAAKRKTSRREDMAYCLMGLFDVNMPLLYGEGDRAFVRLQKEIASAQYDQSIFAWGVGRSIYNEEMKTWSDRQVFARRPFDFKDRNDCFKPELLGPHYFFTNLGLHMEMPVIFLEHIQPPSDSMDSPIVKLPSTDSPYALGVLDVYITRHTENQIIKYYAAMPLAWLPTAGGVHRAARCAGSMPFLVPAGLINSTRRIPLYLTDSPPGTRRTKPIRIRLSRSLRQCRSQPWKVADYYPSSVNLELVDEHLSVHPSSSYTQNIIIRLCHQFDELSILILLTRELPDSTVASTTPTIATGVPECRAVKIGGWWVMMTSIPGDISVWRILLEPEYKEFNINRLRSTQRWDLVCRDLSKFAWYNVVLSKIVSKRGDFLELDLKWAFPESR
ncbi:HET-domain-containing protein [Xylariaceae sp. FL1651]|nr:HET-domain-containing protein [Xylariaceae sp. FL1651]